MANPNIARLIKRLTDEGILNKEIVNAFIDELENAVMVLGCEADEEIEWGARRRKLSRAAAIDQFVSNFTL